MNKIGLKSYDILTKSKIEENPIYESIITLNQIHPEAQKLFQRNTNELDSVILARFTEITGKILQFSRKGAELTAAYIPNLIRYTYEQDVLDFFQNLFIETQVSIYVQNILLQHGFLQFLVNSVQNASYPGILNDQALTLAGTFRVIKMAANSSVFKNQMTNPNVVLNFIRDFPNAPILVKNSRWQAVLSLVTSNNCNVFYPVLNQAINELSNINKNLYDYHLSALKLLLIISSLIEDVSKKLVQMNFAFLLKSIPDNFPEHTFAHSKVFQVFIKTINNPILGPHVFQLLPLVAQTVINRKVILLSAASLKVMLDLQELAKTNKQYEQILFNFVPSNHPCWEVIAKANSLLQSNYGGPIDDTPINNNNN